ncbi:hypothetical protein [Rhizobium sp. LCM 4573]|uniref:hypothetical protein n=1 Tax=Rhizobium sp. LCM 4573 TaxID=1848291 RepID=UPI0008DA688D|nr:hypothetical protein [Rhizobium sp. LCM 4573]OHV78665.1 hypothetical protein LCM4573_26200 [Rhizobium sp. LCM 4573]
MRFQRWILKRLGGTEFVERLKHKHTGGKANKDGRDYEIAYTVHACILELEQILAAFLANGDIAKFERFGFDQEPDAYVDDLLLSGLLGDILVQLKRGGIGWTEVVRDFKIQARADRAHGHKVTYRLVNGSGQSLQWLRDAMDTRGLTSSQAESFVFSKDFDAYSAAHPALVAALEKLSGTSQRLDQKVAYNAILSAFWRTEDRRSFIDLMEEASQHPYNFLSQWEEYGQFDYFETLIKEAVSCVTPKVCGRILHLEDEDGLLQSYLVPFDPEDVESLRSWLENASDAEMVHLRSALRSSGWTKIVRRP